MCTFVGIEESEKALPEFLIYPNPSSGAFTINLMNVAKGTTITVYDVLGQLITSRKVDPNT